MAQDWPGYLWAVATTALLVKETHKLIFRHPQEVYTPYQGQGIPEIKGLYWLTEGCLLPESSHGLPVMSVSRSLLLIRIPVRSDKGPP